MTLRELIDANNLTGTPAEIAAALNVRGQTARRAYYVNARTLMAVAGVTAAETIMASLKATSPTLHAILLDVGDNDGHRGGVDVSKDDSRAFIDQLVTGGLLTSEQGATIKALGEHTISLAESIDFGRDVDHADVERALQ